MVIPAFIMNIADAGKRLLRNKGLLFRFRCSQQFSAHRRRVLLSSVGRFFLVRMCFVLYGIFHVNLFTQKSNQWRACEYDISCLARVVLFCVAHRRDSRNWQPYR